MQTLKRYYINVKFEKYGTYTIEARSKEHALEIYNDGDYGWDDYCLLYTSPSPRDFEASRMPSSA